MQTYFDYIYSYHVLEHVKVPSKALIEMKRVLKDDGVIFIGFPNRNRIIGNMGTYHGYTFYNKIKQNFKDYQYRIKGQFKNEYGAHADFTQKEFISLANDIFSNITCVRNDYFTKKYIHQKNLIKLLIKTGLSEFLFASNYFICKK